MLFHTWPFLVFMLVVLPVFYSLRSTRLWIPWLLAASYFFYAVWNPYYLLLVIYSTALDYLLVTLMDHSPRHEHGGGIAARLLRGPGDRVLKWSFAIFLILTLSALIGAIVGPDMMRDHHTRADSDEVETNQGQHDELIGDAKRGDGSIGHMAHHERVDGSNQDAQRLLDENWPCNRQQSGFDGRGLFHARGINQHKRSGDE